MWTNPTPPLKLNLEDQDAFIYILKIN
jgi:hypothetical protein